MNSLRAPALSIQCRLSLLVAALMPAAAFAQISSNDLVRIEAQVQSEQDRKDIKGSQADVITQNKTILVRLTGKPKSPETRTGTWVAYGRDLKGRDLEVLDRGEFKIDLATGSQKIESKKISATYTPEHSVNTFAGSGKRREVKARKVEAQGKKYVGYVVTVKDGDKVVGQLAEPQGLQTQVK